MNRAVLAWEADTVRSADTDLHTDELPRASWLAGSVRNRRTRAAERFPGLPRAGLARS